MPRAGCGRDIPHVATLELFNTLSGKIDPLTPVGAPALRMYCCGPTVYDYGHIGNFRTFLHVDVLRRFLIQLGIPVQHVMNVTDVDDKIIRNAANAGLPIAEYTAKFEKAFFEDLDALSIQLPEHVAHATECIPEMVSLIQQLAEKDIAYQAEDGSWYFRIARDPDYGKLSKKDLENITDGARVDLDEYEKDAARDFALWKAVKPNETSWDTALGTGRPGWHIECSAMATKFLGQSFDLHAGGEDLMFPHHENEIAQSECASGQTFARHWMHVRFLLVEGRKMSKSEGNFYTLRDLLLKGYRASAIRFLLLSVPYRNQMNFTIDSLTESTNAVDRLRTFDKRIRTGSFSAGLDESIAAATAKAEKDYTAALASDLNTAEARAAIFDLVRAANAAADHGTLRADNVTEILKVLALFDGIFSVLEDRDADLTRLALAWAEREGRFDEASPDLLATLALTDADIDALVAERTQAKKTRNFARADAIRNDLLAKGILIEDSKDGVHWKRK
ncbi:MAG: cysteinyl-tRNA synthetase [Acidobacteriaceae bacterium]|nr:cysteinyl-tRNA synthetase [Acidobacteriaceae bacterium]